MYLTTTNIRKHIQEINNYCLDMEAGIEAIDRGESWIIRIVPIDGLNGFRFSEEARVLYIGSGKNQKAKKLKSKKAIYNLADRYGISHSNVSFHSDYP